MVKPTVTQVVLGAGLGLYAAKKFDDKHHVVNDLSFLAKFVPFISASRAQEKSNPGYTVADMWEENVDANPNKTALVFTEDGRKFTFREIDERANQISHWAIKKGFKCGDVVALFVENRPEFIFAQLGLAKIGVIVALINTNNKSKPLIHSIEVAHSKCIIFGSELAPNVETVVDELKADGIALYSYADPAVAEAPTFEHESLDEQIVNEPTTRVSRSLREGAGLNTSFGYIYTSGTTGLPKACVVKNQKFCFVAKGMSKIYAVTPDDIVYTVLPLYHSAGGMIGLGQMYGGGRTLVLARKFSARNFFKECAEYKATVTQYIGELARYLLQSAPSEWDTKHKIRIAIGNGMRGDIWEPFLDRFNIPELGEFYGATEGNISFSNHSIDRRGVGSVGKYGSVMQKVLKFKIVKHDVVTELPIRDPKTGFCIECDPGEPGEVLGVIEVGNSSNQFAGYTSKEASEKKILKDVFVKGDQYFRTGDLMRRDADGWIYFTDRIGDTFRWKGENVSTGEVAAIVDGFPGVLEANVYGVKVPGNEDGRACMAAIVTENNEVPDFKKMAEYFSANLATYAMPQFIRLLPEMEVTGTFKQRKVDFVKDGMDPSVCPDPLYVLEAANKIYVPLDGPKYLSIAQGQSRL